MIEVTPCCVAGRLPAILSVALPLGAAAGCQAPAGKRDVSRSVEIRDVGGYAEFVARDRRNLQTSKVGREKRRFEETIFEENLKLDLDGYVYHPNFLEFALGGLFGLLQHEYEDESDDRLRTSRDDGTVTEFDFRADLLRKKSHPGTVFARRYRAFEPRPFQPSLEITTTNYGTVWQYADVKTPVNLQFNHTDVRLEPNSDFEEKGRQENTLLRFETAYRFSDNNVLTFLYTFQSVDEEPFELSYDSHELTLSHRWNFGSGHRLDSELNYFDQTGTFDIERFRWREALRFEHTDTFRSWYVFELFDRTQGNLAGIPPIGERSYSLTATLEHRLYESLVAQFSLHGQSQEFDSGLNIDRWGSTITLDYRRPNPWGELLGKYQFRYRREDHTGAEQRSEVLDERHVFQDPEPAVLANTRVETASIMITAEDRLTRYRPGSDYTIGLVGERVEIRRVPTGAIADGEAVLVDYIFAIGGDFDLDSFAQQLTVRHNFDFGLSPFYRLHRQDQTATPKRARGVTPEDITAHVFGVEFVRGPLDLSAEYEDHESNINPFEAVRLNAGYTRRFQSGAKGSIKARWTDVAREPPNERNTRFLSVEGRYRHPITRNLTVEGAILYRQEDDSLSGDDEGIDVDLTLEWSYRQTDLRVIYEFGKFDDSFVEDEFSRLYVQLRRRF